MSRDPLTHTPGYAGSPQGYAGANPVMNTDPGGLRFAPDEGLAEQGGGYGRTEDLTPDDGFDSQAYYSPQNEEVYPDPDPDPTPPAANGDPAADAAPPAASATPTPGHSAAPTSAQKAEPKPGVPGSNGTGSGIGDFTGDFVHDLLALCLTGATASIAGEAFSRAGEGWQQYAIAGLIGCATEIGDANTVERFWDWTLSPF